MSDPRLYEAITRAPKLADHVTTQLQELILSQRLKPGERLPPERDLAEMFAVSRTVVREAVRSLVAKGLLEVRSGSGTYICSVRPAAVAESLGILMRSAGSSYRKIHEVRQLLEVEIARLAAERASAQDIDALERTIRDLELTEGNPDAFAEADVAFHATLARATDNELFSIVLDSIADVLLQVRQKGAQISGTVQRAIHHHTAILARVKAHDAAGAQQAMRDHLEEARLTQMRVLGPAAWE